MRSLPAALLALAVPLTAEAANPVVRFTTVLGSYDVELCQELSAACPGVAPDTVANFLQYVDAGRYPSTGFIHGRTATSPAIEGGLYWVAPAPPLFPKTETFPPIALELGAGLSNRRGSIAMARDAASDGVTSRWFVNLADNVELDGGSAVFGQVVAGLDVVDAIGAVPVYDFNLIYMPELPLIDYPGGVMPVPYLVYVPAVERVPEPAATAGGLAAVAALAWRRALRSRFA